ncbi:MAG: DNA alkylation repair protein [Bacteriovoracaceae bacterium]|nr:DNA alkylation repair protein [Bacteriovoracaceae bacterium]
MGDLLKNQIDKNFVERLISLLSSETKIFPAQVFRKSVFSHNWNNLELKQRITHIVKLMHESLPGTYETKLKVLTKVAPHFSGLGALIFPEFVSSYGQGHWDESIRALEHFTRYCTSEFAIRTFLKLDLKRGMQQMEEWSKHDNEHVRRLASEGCRPRLPWSFKLVDLVKDPADIYPILNQLKDDESLYVRKSVANNLNDISKDHPDLVLSWAKDWIGKSERTDWILKHALRTLLKRGDQRALKLFGVGKVKNIKVTKLNLAQKSFKIGKHLSFDLTYELKGQKPQKVRIEYAIHYHKKNGSKSKKVFKISEKEIVSGTYSLSKKHSLRQMTTRKHYPGPHQIEIILNGEIMLMKTFELIK